MKTQNFKICYWSIAWGNHSEMLQTLVNSFRNVGMKNDFICFSDSVIQNTHSLPLNLNINLSTKNYLFKIKYLQELLNFEYDYFVFLDADSYFVRAPERNIESIISNNKPWVCFLEGSINSIETRRPDWWGVPNNIIEYNFRKLGVIAKDIKNMNAGFWVCKKSFISQAVNLMLECYELFKSQGFNITEEIPMAYLANYLYPDDKSLYLNNYTDYWCSDWVGNFKDQIPKDKKWLMVDYMTGEKYLVNPAIVHAMRSDSALLKK